MYDVVIKAYLSSYPHIHRCGLLGSLTYCTNSLNHIKRNITLALMHSGIVNGLLLNSNLTSYPHRMWNFKSEKPKDDFQSRYKDPSFINLINTVKQKKI